MNLSHTYAAPKPKSYVGIGLVIALHLAGIYALSAGLIRPVARPPEIITLKPLPPDIDREPPPPQPLPPIDKPVMKDVPVIQVPPPDINVALSQEAPLVATVVATTAPGPVVTQPGQTVAPPPTVPTTQVQAPGAVCSTMPRPEVPTVSWSGEAVLQVIATVRGGRVVGSEFRVAQGALDAKTRRSLQRSVESALAGYQCQGDAMFQQDFAFRID
jgi:periplasmic protein TonB